MTDTNADNVDRASVLLALAVNDPGIPGPCPDPERIVAWSEQTLAPTAAAVVQTHVAHCEDCRSLYLALIDTAAPAREPARLPVALRWWQRLGIQVRTAPAVLGGALVAGVAALMLVNVVLLQPTPIPDYSLMIQGQSLARGSEAPADPLSVELRDGNQFSLLLRPATALDEDVAAAFFVLDNGVPRQLDAPPAQTLDKGVVLVEGRVGDDVLLPRGDTPLLIVVGRAGRLPDAAALARRLANADTLRTRHWAAWRVDVRQPE